MQQLSSLKKLIAIAFTAIAITANSAAQTLLTNRLTNTKV